MFKKISVVIGALAVTSSLAHYVHGTAHANVKQTQRQLTDEEQKFTSISPSVCPENMVEINGEFCQNVVETCLYYVDHEGNHVDPPEGDKSGRCGEYAKSKCVSKFEHKHFCIDKYEGHVKKGDVPQSWLSFYDAEKMCKENGLRLCTSSEWAFAAEGPNMHPYPYGDGYHRDKTACNFDHTQDIDVFQAKQKNDRIAQELDKLLVPAGSMERCVSDWGVHDLAGNLDEFVVNESGHPYISGLMGGHVFGVRNASRPMTVAHGPEFAWYETSLRCCTSF